MHPDSFKLFPKTEAIDAWAGVKVYTDPSIPPGEVRMFPARKPLPKSEPQPFMGILRITNVM